MDERSPYSGREVVGELGEVDLYSSDDEKVGRILEVNPQFIVVERGGGFLSSPEPFFIPRDQIGSEDGDRWYLTVAKDQIDTIGWDERPADYTGQHGSTTEGTSTGDEQLMDTDQVRASSDRGMDGDTQTIQVHEEELQAQKTAREAGEVSVTKNVVEETKTIEVPVMREEVRIERHAASDTTASGDHPDAFSGESISVPVMEEQVEVRKVPRAVEEIEISRVQTQDTEVVSDTVRKEQVDIDQPVGGGTPRND